MIFLLLILKKIVFSFKIAQPVADVRLKFKLDWTSYTDIEAERCELLHSRSEKESFTAREKVPSKRPILSLGFLLSGNDVLKRTTTTTMHAHIEVARFPKDSSSELSSELSLIAIPQASHTSRTSAHH